MRKFVNGEIINLKGQFSVQIPVSKGNNIIHIKVLKGKIKLNHGAFNPDGGTWLSDPYGRPAHYSFKEGDDSTINVDIRESFKRLDRISIVNVSLFKSAVIQVTVDREDQSLLT